MKKQTIEMPLIEQCAATQCSYNISGACNARAITVGDGNHPQCDTFVAVSNHALKSPNRAGVGACKVASCRHNDDLECTAELIQIGRHAGHADCLTFASR